MGYKTDYGTPSNIADAAISSQLADIVTNVKSFGAIGDGVADDTAAIQNAINATIGIVYFPKGIYAISSTIKIKYNVILRGLGAGAYFAGSGYTRISVVRPSSGFTGTEIFRADPSDYDAGLSYTYGIAIRDLLIDMYNVKNSGKTAIKLMSLSNPENFENVRVINNNNGIGLHIGVSTNAAALTSDGINFNNFYFLPVTGSNDTTNPVLLLECANEISFRNCKFQSGASVYANSKSVLMSAISSASVAGITFDGCSFTGSETGVVIEGKDTDGTGTRWVRIQNCTFEGLQYGIKLIGTASKPVQFCVLGTGNRFITTAIKHILLSAYATNNQIIVDESTSIQIDANASANQIAGTDTVTDNGTNNVITHRNNDKLSFNANIQGWQTLTLGSGWVSETASRTLFGYRKDYNSNKVILRGYLTGGAWGYPNYIFTLPVGYRPLRPMEFSISCGSATRSCNLTILDDGTVYVAGGSGEAVLDGVEFFLD